jgi:serpin B
MKAGLALCLVAFMTVFATGASAQRMPEPLPRLTVAEQEFSFDLLGRVSTQPGNFVVSPFSISNGLDMVFLGARGPTADEMANVLHLRDLGDADLPAGLVEAVRGRTLFGYFGAPAGAGVVPPDGFKFENADALWGAKGEDFKPAYLAAVKDAFAAEVRTVDFANPPAAAGQINAWVSGRTHGHIKDLIVPTAISAQTRLVLTDAVYFNAGWASDFDSDLSKRQVFHVAPGQDVTARMMHAAGHYTMFRGDGVEMLDLPYRDGLADMLIILPDDRDGLGAVQSELSAEELSLWLEYAQVFNAVVSIPAFKMKDNLDIKPFLQTMGIKRLFSPGVADVSLMVNRETSPVFVGGVIHAATIDVQEKGTVATAATGVTAIALGTEPIYEDVSFVADHPFIYIIRSMSGDILFMGRVENPTMDR